MRDAPERQISKKIPLNYFTVTFYKKGTCHIQFTNLDLLKKFNIYACRKKQWLPPSYGKKSYNEMDPEEKIVIDNFEGEEVYNKVFENQDYFITTSNDFLQLEDTTSKEIEEPELEL